jgi:predicted amidohydrolase
MGRFLSPLVLLCLLPLLAVPLQAREIGVCAVQVRLRLYDTPAQFRAHMGHLTALAMRHHPALIVFPEDVGTPLVALGDRALLTRCASLSEAVSALALRHASELAAIRRVRPCSPQRALFLLKGPAMSQAYTETFAALARRYGVLIAAGSLLLPPEATTDRVVNRMILFGPQGVLGHVDKVHLIPLERANGLDICPADPADLKPIRTSLGSLGLLICADAWYPELSAGLLRHGAELLVNCLANMDPWCPETEADLAASLPARVRETGLPGVQAFAVTGLGRDFLGLTLRGRSQILLPSPMGEREEGERGEAPGPGFRVLVQAQTSDREEIVFARVPLP